MPVRGNLVGRQAELTVIQHRLNGLRPGERRAVFVEIVGEPGIGKTRLLGEVAALAGERGHVVMSGRATELERDVPFAAVVDALDDHLAELDPPDRKRLCGIWLGLLAEVFPALQEWRPRNGAGVPEAERIRLHRAVRALLEVLAEPSGLVVLLDDVQWADPGSVELLVHLLRHPPRAPVLIGMSYRVDRAPSALGATLADAALGDLGHRVELGPLTVHAAAELLGRPVEGCHVLYEHSGGNPLYLQLLAGGDPAALLAELDSLTPSRRLVAAAAAVTGDPFEAELVAPAAAMGTAETLEALDDLVGRDLLRIAGDRLRLQFRHPLVRQLTYDSAGAGWRASAHRRLAAVLEQRGAPLAARAHHLAGAGRPAGAPPGERGLTARERDVAELVMHGCSNRAIAEELVLSVRTVTTHMSHILAKLGVSSRAGIAGVLVRSSTPTTGPR